jgi:hypothetical protein
LIEARRRSREGRYLHKIETDFDDMFDQLRANEQRMWQLRDEENGVELVDTDSD